jgi:hypothetical protein
VPDQLARDADLLGQVVGMFLHKVFAWQRGRARAHGIVDPHCGAVTCVQRFGSMLNLNCHAHALVSDGVFAANSDGSVLFHLLPPPWDDDVAKLLEQIARAIHRLITRYLAARSANHHSDDVDIEHDEPSRTRRGDESVIEPSRH